MRSSIVAAGIFAVTALAGPLVVKREYDTCGAPGGGSPGSPGSPGSGGNGTVPSGPPPCLTFDEATTVGNNFKELQVAYTDAAADAYLTPDFTDYSDSVISLINGGCAAPLPLGSPVFSSRDEFKAAQAAQGGVDFEILNLWHTCDTVVLRWRIALAPQFVTGISVLELEYVDGEWDIATVYAEFNAGAWLVDTGVFVPVCPAPPPPFPAGQRRSLGMPHRMYPF